VSVYKLSENPKISIVTVSFNQVEYLETCMRSVLEQDYENIEYLVIDGGSTDGSKAIIEKYSDCLAYWQSQKDAGQTDAINQGFARATGEVYAWLNSDDLLLPGTLRKVVEALKANPEVGMVYGDCLLINAKGKALGRFPAAQTDYAKLRQGYVHIPQQASFWRAELWKQVAPLDPSFYFAMDYDLWVRLAKLAPLRYLPGEPWAAFRLHGGAKSLAAADRCWPEMMRVHYRDGGSPFSLINLKYWLRKAAAPLINWRRRRFADRN